MDAHLLKGNLELLLLAVLETQPAHGYAIIKELQGRSDGGLDLAEGTVYPALYRLEKQGLLRSRRAEVGGRQRRVYTITAKGKATRRERAKSWLQFSRSVSAVLREAP